MVDLHWLAKLKHVGGGPYNKYNEYGSSLYIVVSEPRRCAGSLSLRLRGLLSVLDLRQLILCAVRVLQDNDDLESLQGLSVPYCSARVRTHSTKHVRLILIVPRRFKSCVATLCVALLTTLTWNAERQLLFARSKQLSAASAVHSLS